MNKREPRLKVKEEEINLLNQALYHFNLSTSKLQDSYNQLQRQVSTLNLELEKKNEQLKINLREKERIKDYLYSILESLNSGVVVVNGEGRVTTFNRAAELITGITKEEAEENIFNSLLEPLLSDDITGIFPLSNFKMSEGEFILKWKDGRETRVRISITPLRGKELEGSVIILQDINQLKKLEEQAERNNRLTAMGEIAVSIAHEVRNPLGSIELLASLLRREVEDDEDKRRLTDHILTGVKSIDYIINNLLLFSKPQCPVFKKVSIHTFLDESLLFIIPSLRQNQIKLIKKYDSFDPLVLGDSELLKQVFLNLAWNAIQAMPEGGQLTIITEIFNSDLGSNSRLSLSLPFSQEHSNTAGCLEMKFIDSGVGISDEDKGKIFNPFFTTKEKGTGLGLAIAHNIIEVHGGMIGVESSVGQGSTFTITMPLAGKEEPRD
jgi:two-component system sensor histidine kinase FlrB